MPKIATSNFGSTLLQYSSLFQRGGMWPSKLSKDFQAGGLQQVQKYHPWNDTSPEVLSSWEPDLSGENYLIQSWLNTSNSAYLLVICRSLTDLSGFSLDTTFPTFSPSQSLDISFDSSTAFQDYMKKVDLGIISIVMAPQFNLWTLSTSDVTWIIKQGLKIISWETNSSFPIPVSKTTRKGWSHCKVVPPKPSQELVSEGQHGHLMPKTVERFSRSNRDVLSLFSPLCSQEQPKTLSPKSESEVCLRMFHLGVMFHQDPPKNWYGKLDTSLSFPWITGNQGRNFKKRSQFPV